MFAPSPDVGTSSEVSAPSRPRASVSSTRPLERARDSRAEVRTEGRPTVAGSVTPAARAPSAPSPQPPRLEQGQAQPSDEVRSDDPRLRVRWGKPGLCEEGTRPLVDREALLSRFVAGPEGAEHIRRDPVLPALSAEFARQELDRAHRLLRILLGSQVDAVRAPSVFLYSSVEQLVSAACVNRATRGYYDGAIHVATERDLSESLLHEYTHHVLNQLGVRKPMWLHEGMAMLVARETWWQDPRLGLHDWLPEGHLPFEALVEAFPHTADELFAGAAYYQSIAMVFFIRVRGAQPDLGVLVEQLARGEVSPRSAFAYAAGREGRALHEAFRDYVHILPVASLPGAPPEGRGERALEQ
ncbi:hypothetical protein [Cystobacter fuscus]|uniref:hypothetical protein n=1 Tax=Cystobacter fuscus TaxID=43 RepID=UPI002B31B262|nr:hypothetical protein F0U63_29225 [Cystobacter fuscus]